MAYNTKTLKTDVGGKNPVPQVYNPSTDDYEPLQGSGAAGARMTPYDAGGSPLFSEANPGRVRQSGSLTQLDATITPLSASATYTSAAAFDVSKYRAIVGTVFADQAGTLYVEQSWDNGTHWDVSSIFTASAGVGVGYEVDVIAPKCRLRFVNGSTAQTAFRLYVGGRAV